MAQDPVGDLVTVRLGPTGPRAVVTDGPEVWEVIAAWVALRREQQRVELSEVAARMSITVEQVQAAVDWYRTHRAEVERDLAVSQFTEVWRARGERPAD